MTYAVYIKYLSTIRNIIMDCIIDVTFPDNVTVPEIKEKAIEKIKRLNGSLVNIKEVKVLRGWN